VEPILRLEQPTDAIVRLFCLTLSTSFWIWIFLWAKVQTLPTVRSEAMISHNLIHIEKMPCTQYFSFILPEGMLHLLRWLMTFDFSSFLLNFGQIFYFAGDFFRATL
jgi:hypothetical protein